ncbi:MAG: Crp/Fnr family transcriptional regulator [Alphaproteobacteria bacterium]|nr:Crp/Fnr family transcriptional regulator [Alphaproteobacteria bacterium]
MNDANFTLSGIDLFGSLTASELEALAKQCRWRRYAPGQHIIGDRDETTDVFFIASGRVRATVYSPAGKEVSFRDLGAGASIGELSAVDGAPRSANVIALSESVLASVPAAVFQKILRDHPDVSARMMSYLVGLVRKLSDRVVEFSVLAVRNRIHAELLRLARERAGDGNTVVLSPPPTHADIASRIATHREAVTRELNVLAGDGLIERRRGSLVIRDVARLTRLVEEGLEQ